MTLRIDHASYMPTHGETVGPWLVLERLDSGAHGVVFRAQRAGHPEAGLFALKMARKERDARFEREAALLQRVRHPAVPRFEDAGLWTSPTGSRHPYVVMEWVEGFTLYDWARERERSTREVLHVLAQVARGLEAVHAVGAVHRDVKGDNIRVTPGGRAVLVDFGSGWLPGARPLTDTAAPPGTTPYRAPEQLRFMWKFRMDLEAHWHARPSDDLYSLGVTAYRLVTGSYLPPVVEDEPPRKQLPPRELSTVAQGLEDLILRLLSEAWEARGTTQKIAEDLEHAARHAGPEADRPIRPTPSALPTEEGLPRLPSRSSSSRQPSRPRPSTVPERRGPRVTVPAWLSWVGASVIGGVLTTLLIDPRYPARPPVGTRIPAPPPIEVPAPWDVQEPLRETAGPTNVADAGVEEAGLVSAHEVPRGGIPTYALALPMPKKPFPGQRKPPCRPYSEIALIGACWTVIRLEPPCRNEGFEVDKMCVIAAFDGPTPNTSQQP
jgi:eukaryotic-like serine/threonine-protein kinase